MHTNINITDNEYNFEYIVEYRPQNLKLSTAKNHIKYKKSIDNKNIELYNQNILYKRNGNIWESCKDDFNDAIDLNIKYSLAKFRLYFPQFSVDTYKRNIKYALSLNTYINGIEICLGTYILDRFNSKACEEIKIFNNKKYYEYIELDIIDPYELMYGDNWDDFRKKICGELIESNNTGSELNIILYPVIEYRDHYIMLDDYNGAQNSLNIGSDGHNDYMKANIYPIFTGKTPGIKFDLVFNKLYNDDIKLYIKETYGYEIKSIKYELILIDNDSTYTHLKQYNSTSAKISHIFQKNDIIINNDTTEEIFSSWDYWKEGLVFTGSINIYFKESDKVINIFTNKIPMTQELYKYFVNMNDPSYNKIDLNKIDMKITQINAVNKIINKVIKVDKPQDSKSNIIMPVFFRATELNKITIHPEVTENICINLDPYKSKVDTFILQIEGKQFKEIGSNYRGIIFKIEGNILPKKILEGTFYILNENYEVITSGKYNYK